MADKVTIKMMGREFHISRQARDRYRFDESLFALSGNVIFANFHAARVFSQKMNNQRDLIRFPEQTIKAGQINAMGLIDEILHYVVGLYREQMNRDVMKQAMDWLVEQMSVSTVDTALRKFVDDFPPLAVYRGEIDRDAYFQGETNGVPNRQIVLEEMIMLWLENVNPAFSPYQELFDDTELSKLTAYRQVISSLHDFFQIQPHFGPDNQNLLDMLRSPAIAVPYSLYGQLEYIREKWGALLGRFLYRLLGGLDFIREEEKVYFVGPGISRPLDFSAMEAEYARYSQDKDWMPRVVMIAKSTYVWLDQLSKKYQRPINRLDQIPDEELDTLARWGFTSLWLIGLWERSRASQRIKQLCGNPEAVASAYSLFDYQIASDLGGDVAFQNLKERAFRRGIRMAGDMVPNHVGIDGKWVIEHPDWFIALTHSPFPSYNFNGANLSWDQRVGIYLEDHYYTHSDAAVIFKRVDHWTGDVKYIYHGNDGTRMPWNDTAQLNYLKPEVREAVIQTILHVARKFPVIRFDAAMTLTKRHYQRLWYPQPGTGGDIPTRAEYGLTRADFDVAMPQEFWRELVDRVTQEAPETLLLAEAFWLMEGFFVRTLGMHRVYNSAFMNMLKNEDNANYRLTIKKVLEFDPEILKRFVNFMNNPDEETAIAQFGKEDKYFGVCMMMVTMPGLPMFGHGQIEGFTEKYGMEYRRSYWDEHPDQNLIQRHEREIFPLMRRRFLFAHVHHFLLYDFFTTEGLVNEDVFAYSNRAGDEHALIVYHNRYQQTRGWIRTSCAFITKSVDDAQSFLIQKTLGEGLGLHHDESYFCIFRDHQSGLEYIRNCKELYDKGLYIELKAYQYHVFLDFHELQDNIWHHYANLATFLNGRGVPNIQETLKETFLQPIHYRFKEIVNPGMFRYFLNARIVKPGTSVKKSILDQSEEKVFKLLQEIKQFCGASVNEQPLAEEIRFLLNSILTLPAFTTQLNKQKALSSQKIANYLTINSFDSPFIWNTLLGWWSVCSLGKIVTIDLYEGQSRSWIDEMLLGKVIAGTFKDLGIDESSAWQSVSLIKLLTSHQNWFDIKPLSNQTKVRRILETLLRDNDVQQFLKLNRHQEILWFNKEAFDQLLWWLFIIAVIKINTEPLPQKQYSLKKIASCYKIIQQLLEIENRSGYQVEKLLQEI